MASDGLTCPACGTTYRGAAVRHLDGGFRATYDRDERGVYQRVFCICQRGEAGPVFMCLRARADVVIVRDGGWSMSSSLGHVVRGTKATLWIVTHTSERKFSAKTGHEIGPGTKGRLPDEELQRANEIATQMRARPAEGGA